MFGNSHCSIYKHNYVYCAVPCQVGLEEPRFYNFFIIIIIWKQWSYQYEYFRPYFNAVPENNSMTRGSSQRILK